MHVFNVAVQNRHEICSMLDITSMLCMIFVFALTLNALSGADPSGMDEMASHPP